MDAIRKRFTFANVVACLALLVALTGGAYAASLPKHSVGTKQLKKNAVTSAKVKDGSLTVADLAGLPAAPTYDASLAGSAPMPPTGSTATEIRTVNGVKFSLLCQGGAPGAVNVRIEAASAAAVAIDGVQTRSDSYPIGTNNVMTIKSSHAATVGLETGFRYTAFTGMVQADNAPAMFLSLHTWIESGNCYLRGVTSAVVH